MELRHVVVASDFANINGGQAKVAIESARLLADEGLSVTFFAACGTPDPALQHPGIRVVALGEHDILSDPQRLRAVIRGIWNAGAVNRLRSEIEAMDPSSTILHVHGYAKALSPAIGPVMINGPLASVYTMHEYFLACPNGGFYDYQKNEICNRKALGAACLTTNCDVRHPAHKAWRVLRQAATWGPGRMPRRLRDVVYISETQRRVMAPYLSEQTRLHYIPNPLALAEQSLVNAAANDIFLFVGRLNPEKGGLMFAKAALDAGVKAVFVGDGAEAEAIRAANPEAVITGWQTPDEVQSWIGRARALVFPSLWYEGQPLVPMEALTRGVPVVAGSWSAAAEVVRDGVNGVVYNSPTEVDLVAALHRVMQLGDFNTSGACDLTAPSTHVDNLRKLYNALLEERAQ